MADQDETSVPWPLQRQDAPAIARSLAAEIESNTCPICFELMKSPDYSPIVLYPCGHTFCVKCLEIHTVKNRKKTCPYCRQRIISQALNLSLQKLINNFVALQNNPVPKDSFGGAQYAEKLRQVETRSKVLQCALENIYQSKADLSRDIASTERQLMESRRREAETKAKLDKLVREHQVIVCQIRDNQDRLATMQKLHEEETARVNLIQETMRNLAKDYDKLKLFVSS